jgi:type IV pilus assembly protein PilB
MVKQPKLGELLVRAGAIDQTQLEAALGEQKKWGSPLGMTIVRMGFLDEETLVRTLARQLKLPLAWLRGKRIKPQVLALVPNELALKHRCLPMTCSDSPSGRVLFLAMQDPADLAAVDEVAFRTGCKVKAVLAAPGELEEALKRHYQLDSGASPDRILDLASPEFSAEDDGPEILLLDREVVFSAEDEDGPLEFVDGPVGPEPNAALEALIHLANTLLEKGAIDRDELVERIGELASQVPGSR